LAGPVSTETLAPRNGYHDESIFRGGTDDQVDMAPPVRPQGTYEVSSNCRHEHREHDEPPAAPPEGPQESKVLTPLWLSATRGVSVSLRVPALTATRGAKWAADQISIRLSVFAFGKR
jgi:hypothetical protein